ncbi:hypothetical protein RESH_03303 [Rhodopirellula europaea SH398]|uniref:Uncharacterized protein n=1 Tax=Rhodopirellula europaea SH398 TaxID=1263868 RepID=M5SEM6_9BACT|nr:hypothetical protein RESH_03303 [Rhodopirellula europaea SH398]
MRFHNWTVLHPRRVIGTDIRLELPETKHETAHWIEPSGTHTP